MGWKLDIRSVVVGAAVVAAAAIFLGATKSEPAVGRYQVSVGANTACVIDTMTGQVWASGASGGAMNNPAFSTPKTETAK